MKSPDLVGKQFRRLTVASRSGHGPQHGRVYWKCECECGGSSIVSTGALMSGNSRSCGCSRHDDHSRHGHSRRGKSTRTYSTWVGMRQRCSNPNGERWAEYGGRGIKVCDRWLNSFENFLADMGEKPVGLSLDRIDVNGNYELANCRWATDQTQARNRRPAVRPRVRKGWKLTPDAVLAIRACHKAGVPQNAIATAFLTSRAMVCLIVNEKCWKNING